MSFIRFFELSLLLYTVFIYICNEIAYKLDLLILEERGTTKNLQYLFDWNKIPGNDAYRIKELLKRIMNTEFLDLTEIKKVDSNKSIECSFEINGGWPYVAIFDLKIDKADLMIWEKGGDLREVKDFIAEKKITYTYTKRIRIRKDSHNGFYFLCKSCILGLIIC